jgi:hypothetical protein
MDENPLRIGTWQKSCGTLRSFVGKTPLEVQKPLPPYAVQILEHHGGHTSSCMTSQASACEHIADVMKLPGMNWSPAELNILDEFARGDKCKSILDPPR